MARSFWKLDTSIICDDCKTRINGNITLDRFLKLCDSEGFTIVFDEILCNECMKKNEGLDMDKTIDPNDYNDIANNVEMLLRKFGGKAGNE